MYQGGNRHNGNESTVCHTGGQHEYPGYSNRRDPGKHSRSRLDRNLYLDPRHKHYTAGVALADMINEHSSWLTATALASESLNATAEMLLTSKAETAIGNVVIPNLLNGFAPFEEPNDDLRCISSFGCVANGFVTLDPDIETMEDLEGKRVMLGPVGGYIRRDIPMAVLEYRGIDCTYSYGGFADSVDALINGQVDVIFGSAFAIKSDYSLWATHASLVELVSRYDVNYVSIDPIALDYIEDKLNFHQNPPSITVPAYGYDSKFGKEVTVLTNSTDWVCNEVFPSDVIQEILRIETEYYSEFADYWTAGAYISPETLAKVALPDYIHPAAKEFYTQQGVWED
jgi:TRAP transporter TAXI family solute receptor